MHPTTECSQELVVAVFRLAVADTLAMAYGHDGPTRYRRVTASHSREAASFLASRWADHLADLSGFGADSVRQELARLAPTDPGPPEAKRTPRRKRPERSVDRELAGDRL
jgi:hypothetical protein